MTIVSGHQPVYLPWLGLFHKLSLADVFVFMDDVQYLENDWNNRNKIKGSQGTFWLTAPVRLKASASRLLKDICLDSEGDITGKRHWQNTHWQSIQRTYKKSPFWNLYADAIEEMYTGRRWEMLADLNEYQLKLFIELLGISTRIVKATETGFTGAKSDLVLDHCRKLEGSLCVLGTFGREYLQEEDFFHQGVSIYYQDYHHPEYPQRFGDFAPFCSVLDLLFNCGPESLAILLKGNITKDNLIKKHLSLSTPSVIPS